MPSDWDIRSIYELPPDDFLEAGAFWEAFGRERDINGHKLLTIQTPPKISMMTSRFSSEHEGLDLADTVLILRTRDVHGITPGENIRVDAQLYRVLKVSSPVREVIRLDLQGVDG